MKSHNPWEENAEYIKGNWGGVNYVERCYICPECGEPIYESDWTPRELSEFLCPVCEWEGD